jgi:RNA polymerase sigma factor (sigma-70 family)
MMNETQELLANFVRTGSESAFRELVTRYFDLVYSTAVRLVEGDTHKAEDVSQIVFADLAKMAGKLSAGSTLGGWLHRHTCFVARTVMRGERRRQARERQAAEMNALQDKNDSVLTLIAPILDEVIQELGPDDRDAILLRFFEHRKLRAIGDALGTTENVAQKRVTRAVEALGVLLQRRGVTLSAAALAAGLTAGAVTAAPAGLALSVAGTVLSGGGAVGIGVTWIKIATATKFKIAVVGAIVVVSIVTGLYLQTQSRKRETRINTVPAQQPAREQEGNLAGIESAMVASILPSTNLPKVQSLNPETAKIPETNTGKGLGPDRERPTIPVQARDMRPADRLYVGSGSKVRISGTSNVRDWQAESRVITGSLEVGPGFPISPDKVTGLGRVQAKADVYLGTRSLRSVDRNSSHDSDALDQVIHENLKAEQYPTIHFHLLDLELKGRGGTVSFIGEARGELEIAGITNEVEMRIQIFLLGDGKFRISGRASSKMSLFEIETRGTKLGTMLMQAGDDVKIEFEWLVAAKGVIQTQPSGRMTPLILDLPTPVFRGVPKDLQRGSEIEPISDVPRPLLMVPGGVKNIAPGSKLTSSDKNASATDLAKITDGDKEGADRSIQFLRKGTQWVQMDLGKPHEIFAMVIWHAHNTAKIYHDVIVQVADDPDFAKNIRTLFNNDSDKSSELGAGTDKEYFETYEGKLIDAKGITNRYVRFYSKGSTESALNEYTEIEIYGRPVQ